jgi:hypothetical protein
MIINGVGATYRCKSQRESANPRSSSTRIVRISKDAVRGVIVYRKGLRNDRVEVEPNLHVVKDDDPASYKIYIPAIFDLALGHPSRPSRSTGCRYQEGTGPSL